MAVALCLSFAPGAMAQGALLAHRVVVVVFDGMRPDFISAENTPNLMKLAEGGVFFAHHHPVYVSSTEVNGTAMATGTYPARSTVIANVDYRPRIDGQLPINVEVPAIIRKGDEVSGGRYIEAPTVAEILHSHGLGTVIAGSKQVALLHDRARRPNDPGSSPVLYEGAAMPPSLEAPIGQAMGDFPPIPADQDKIARDAWTTGALLDFLWKGGVPPYTLLWLSEPDFSQHAAGPGAAQSLAAVRSSDANLGRIIAYLDKRGLRDTTDIFVVSDHGFSTIAWKVDVAAELSTAGFHTERVALGGLKPGDVMVVSEGAARSSTSAVTIPMCAAVLPPISRSRTGRGSSSQGLRWMGRSRSPRPTSIRLRRRTWSSRSTGRTGGATRAPRAFRPRTWRPLPRRWETMRASAPTTCTIRWWPRVPTCAGASSTRSLPETRTSPPRLFGSSGSRTTRRGWMAACLGRRWRSTRRRSGATTSAA